MKILKKKYLVVFLLMNLLLPVSNAQQIIQLSQRMSDVALFNPAAYGAMNNNQVKLLHRSQWVGFEGAPQTQLLTYSATPGRQNGLGLYALNDVAGATHRFSAGAGYSHHIAMSRVTLALGVSARLSQYFIDRTKLQPADAGDVLLSDNDMRINWVPDATFGAMLYNRHFFAGISASQMVESRVQRLQKLSGHTVGMYHFTAGYNWRPSPFAVWQPAVLITYSRQQELQAELNLRSKIRDKFIGGLAYRTNDAVIVMAGIEFSPVIIVYSYDILLSGIRNQSSGSHEIVLTYRLKTQKGAASVPLMY